MKNIIEIIGYIPIILIIVIYSKLEKLELELKELEEELEYYEDVVLKTENKIFKIENEIKKRQIKKRRK